MIAGWPGPDSAPDRSGADGPTVASWLSDHPDAVPLPAPVDATSIDAALRSVEQLLKGQDLLYLGPGCPMLDDPLAPPLKQAALQANLNIHVQPAPPFWLGAIDAGSGFSVRSPADITDADLSIPLVVSGLMSATAIIEAATAILARSDSASITLISRFGDSRPIYSDNLAALELPSDSSPHALVTGPVSALHNHSAIQSLLWVVERLRAPDGCPWDRRQTHRSLQRYLPEEAYEAAAAIDENDPAHLAEELGDVLLQIALHARIATETGEFLFADVVAGITRKMIHRHPHVFGDVSVDGVDDVLRNWEELKAAERDTGDSLTDGISASLPALTYARELLRRAARSGMELPPAEVDGLLTGAEQALVDGADSSASATVLGELLFHLVELADRHGLDPEFALRQAMSRRIKERADA